MGEETGIKRYFYSNEDYIIKSFKSGMKRGKIGEFIKNKYNIDVTDRTCRSHVYDILKKAGLIDKVVETIEEIGLIDFESTTDTKDYDNSKSINFDFPKPEDKKKPEKANIEDRLIEECEKYGLDPSAVSSYKFVNHNGQDKLNIAFHPDYKKDNRTSDDWLDNFKDMIEDRIDPKIPTEVKEGENILIMNIADLHVGMDPNFEGSSIWEATWTKQDIIDVAYEIVAFIKKKFATKAYQSTVLNLLGDLVDGFNAETTRGGHKLPQNMSNIEQSDIVVLFLYTIVQELHKEKIPVFVYGTSNSNHGGDFEHFALQKFQLMAQYEFNTPVVISEKLALGYNLPGTRKPIMIMHGKDKQFATRPFPAKIDDKDDYKIEAIIDAVCDRRSHLKPIVFKGDSHQHVIQSKKNYEWVACMTNAPSSDWVKNNFFNTSKGGITYSIYSILTDTVETGLLPFDE